MMLFVAVFVSGCASTPPATYEVNNQQVVQQSYDVAWSAVIEFFADNMIPIDVLEKESGVIVSRAITIRNPVLSAWVDCGSMGGRSLSHIDTIIARVDFNIRIASQENGTLFRVNFLAPTQLNRTDNGFGWLDHYCVSTGKFESSLIEFVSSK